MLTRARFRALWVICVLLSVLVDTQSLLHFEHGRHNLSNNSYIFIPDISVGDSAALKCVVQNMNCCNNSTVGGWKDWEGEPVYEGANGTTCLYVNRGDGVISLHRKRLCTDYTSGLWRCDIPDSSGEMQSLYIYLGDKISYNPLGKMKLSYYCVIIHSTALEHRATEQVSDCELYSTH